MMPIMLVDVAEYTVAGPNPEIINTFLAKGLINDITYRDDEYMIYHIYMSDHQKAWMQWYLDTCNSQRESAGNKIKRYTIFKTEEF